MEDTTYVVVKNLEDQYSIWDHARAVPAGWHPQAMTGTKAACLEYIRVHWTDMTPASLKHAMLG